MSTSQGAQSSAPVAGSLGRSITDARFAYSLTALFFVIVSVSISHHEMWQDELQAWLISRDSRSIADLFHHLKYEGHPALWHLLLMPISRVFRSPVAMQVFHVLIATTTVYVFATFAPFTRLQKVLFVFGYYSIYEYSVVARNYALGLLLLCIACTLFSQRPRRIIWICVVLVLMAHTSVHAAIVAIAMSAALLLDHLLDPDRRLIGGQERNWLGFALIAAGIVALAWQLNPAPDAMSLTPWMTSFDDQRARSVGKVIASAFLPLPVPGPRWWLNMRWLEAIPYVGTVQFGFSVLFAVWCTLGLLQKPAALLMYASATIGLLVFFYVVQTGFSNVGAIRHQGFVFLAFVAVAWLQHSCRSWNGSAGVRRLHEFWLRSMNPVFTGILCVQVVGGAVATGSELTYTFSNAKPTAEYIAAHGLQDLPTVGEYDMASVAVVGYLGTPGMHYVRGKRFGSFVVFDKARGEFLPTVDGPTPDVVLEFAREVRSTSRQSVLLVLSKPLAPELVARDSIVALAAFTDGAMASEYHYLYLMRRSLPTARRNEPVNR